MQPVAGVFRMAREANPKLAKVGVVWNPAESNSEASTIMAREVCKQLNIELVEMTIDSSSAVLDAVKALLARKVQAIWAGGDATVAPAIETLIRHGCRRRHSRLQQHAQQRQAGGPVRAGGRLL